MKVNFEWDEAKNRANIPDVRKDYGERRWIGTGLIRGRTAVVVFTERSLETIRILSLRKATRRERKQYEKAVQNELEAG